MFSASSNSPALSYTSIECALLRETECDRMRKGTTPPMPCAEIAFERGGSRSANCMLDAIVSLKLNSQLARTEDRKIYCCQVEQRFLSRQRCSRLTRIHEKSSGRKQICKPCLANCVCLLVYPAGQPRAVIVRVVCGILCWRGWLRCSGWGMAWRHIVSDCPLNAGFGASGSPAACQPGRC